MKTITHDLISYAHTINCVCHNRESVSRVHGIYNFVYNLKKSNAISYFLGALLCTQSHTCTLKYSAWSSGGAIFLGLNGVCDAPDMDRIEPRNPRFRSYGPRLESDSEQQFLTHFGATLSPKIGYVV